MARKNKGKSGGNPNRPRFWGKHAVAAALDNPDRRVLKAWSTAEAAAFMNFPKELAVVRAEAPDLGRMVPSDAPHHGVVIEVEPLDDIWLADLLAEAPERAVLLVLDQVTDPHNVGAILRSAAAFGAIGIVTQDRHAPPESGALAKAASGALERVPWVRVVNLARALEEIAEAGFWRIGLAGLVLTGELDLAHLPEDDEEAIAHLIKIKGIGRWSAEIYLLFAEGRSDIWPAGDLAVQIEIGKLLGLDERPSEKLLRELAEAWRPHRGAAAVLAWHSYNAPPL
jgi:23S rRNA (guanosine2251-2'-O)-methyltransferase